MQKIRYPKEPPGQAVSFETSPSILDREGIEGLFFWVEGQFMADTDIQTELNQAAIEPIQASDDGGSVRARSASDMIEADGYTQAGVVMKKKTRGVLFAKFKPPGCQ